MIPIISGNWSGMKIRIILESKILFRRNVDFSIYQWKINIALKLIPSLILQISAAQSYIDS